jgi:dihydroflavonol-4-reductase
MKKLVIGASGFLGSHVTRQLADTGADVRVMLRRTSSTKGIDDLDVERCYGDVFDDDALRAAMSGCDVVYYCVVDARMWLRDRSCSGRMWTGCGTFWMPPWTPS